MKHVFCILLVGLATLSGAATAAAADKPNIVYILVDNWGWGDISVQGSTVRTPRIDAFAAEGRPFFTYVGFTHFHPPWGVHDDFAGASGAGLYADTKLEVDHNVGQILDAIRAAGIEESTLVILTGDNGAANYPSPGIVTGEVGGSNGPWRGGLSTAYEGGMQEYPNIKPGQDFRGYGRQ